MVDGRCGHEFTLGNGVRQGDAQSATLFNLALQGALDQITDNGTIIYKSRQICAYADDIVIIARSQNQLKETYAELHHGAKKAGLEVNEGKTKYMVMSAEEQRRVRGNLSTENMTFENVDRFVYLGAEVNNRNRISEEIQRRIMTANRAYFANIKLLRSRLLSRTTKMRIYKSLIRPVATYGCETWNITNSDANKLRVFERAIVRRIYGPIYENGFWRIRFNHEIDDILKQEDIVRFAKSQRLRWLGHVERMPDLRITKRIYNSSMTGRRLQGRPRNRWKDEVEADMRIMNVRHWKTLTADRQGWRDSVVEQAKAHTGL